MADAHTAFFLYLSFRSYFACRFVPSRSVWCLVFPVFVAIWFLPASICVLVASVLMMLPSASETSSEAPSETSFAIPHLHPLLFFSSCRDSYVFSSKWSSGIEAEWKDRSVRNPRRDTLGHREQEKSRGCSFWSRLKDVSELKVEHEQVTHLKARDQLRWRRTSGPLFPGDMTVDVSFSGSLRAWKLWTSWNK